MRSCSRTTSMPGDHLAHRVLDLQAGVDLEERVRRALLVDEELAGRGARVVERGDEPHGGVEDLAVERAGEAGRGRLLDQLLVAALQRAVAVADVDRVAVPVAEHLHLDVAGAADEALDEQPPVAERLLGLGRAPTPRRRRAPPAGRPGACRARRRRPPP